MKILYLKKALFVVIALLVVQKLFCQHNDTLKVAQDTVIKPVSKNEKPVKSDTRPLKERIAFGFGSSFWIQPSQTYVELAPVIAYRFPKTLITGVGYRYIYRRQRIAGQNLNAYGPDLFARVNILKRVYFWTEYELLHNEYLLEVAGQELTREKTTTDSWFAGLGYIRSVGKRGRGGISVQVLYNMLYNRDDISPYYSPVTYRVGYYF